MTIALRFPRAAAPATPGRARAPIRRPALLACATALVFLLRTLSAAAVPPPANATYRAIEFPGPSNTEINDVHRTSSVVNAVEVVGTYTDIRGSHGFRLSRGQYTSLDVPGASSTTALGINGRQEIVGTYWSGGMVCNYKYSQGTYTPVVDVCAIGHNHDSVRGINNAGM
jgi:hypothetical protein